MRNVNISVGFYESNETEADRWAQLNEQCGGDKPIRDALGYLSLWNWEGFPHVDIVVMGRKGEMEILATYRKEAGGAVGYSIGAVWHGDHFGFHS